MNGALVSSSVRTENSDPISDAWLETQLGRRTRATREVCDVPGLYVRFSVLGRIEFEARYLRSWPMRMAGSHAKNRLILGEFPKMSIEQARMERRKFTEEIRTGIDPASTRFFERTRKAHFQSVEDLFWQWFDELSEDFFTEGRTHQRVVIAEYEKYIFSSMPVIPECGPVDFAAEDWMDAIGAAYVVDPAVGRRLWWGVNKALYLALDAGAIAEHTLSDKTFTDFERYVQDEVNEGFL